VGTGTTGDKRLKEFMLSWKQKSVAPAEATTSFAFSALLGRRLLSGSPTEAEVVRSNGRDEASAVPAQTSSRRSGRGEVRAIRFVGASLEHE